MSDLISRQAAITLPIMPKEYRKHKPIDCDDAYEQGWGDCQSCIGRLPTAEPEIKPIEYRDCANAMLRMWMDNVVSDGEYNRIMDKLNSYWGGEWQI